MALGPILRAIPETGQSWDDPSEDLLFILLGDIEAGEGSFLIIERTTDPTGHTYAQALRNPDGSYIVEHREGDAEHHYGTVVRTCALLTDCSPDGHSSSPDGATGPPGHRSAVNLPPARDPWHKVCRICL